MSRILTFPLIQDYCVPKFGGVSMTLSANAKKIFWIVITGLFAAAGGGILTALVGFGSLTTKIAKLEKIADDQLVPAARETAAISARVSEISEKRLPQMEQREEASEKTLNSLDGTVGGIKRKMNDEVIPWVNRLKAKEGPTIQPAALQHLYDEQEHQRTEIAQIKEVDEKRAGALQAQVVQASDSMQAQVVQAKESSERKAAALQEELQDLSDTLWTVEEPALRSKLDQNIKKAMRPIIAEWQEVAWEKSRPGAPVPAVRTFIPLGVTVSTKPHVEATLRDGVITLSGVVPSEKARDLIIHTIESFQPKPLKIVSDKLVVRP